MTPIEIVGLILGSNLLIEVIKGWFARRKTQADTELTSVQAAGHVVNMLSERVDRMDKEQSSLLKEVGIIRRSLYLADKALFYLVRHDGIATAFPSEVEYAVKMRRGEIDDSDVTPVLE
jgi:hypothetical protein